MTSRRDFLILTAGAGLASAAGCVSAARTATAIEPQRKSERQRLIAEAQFGPKQKAASTEGMAITSHPLATRDAVKILKAGGNACDAALCAAMSETVIGPHLTGITGVLSTMYYDATSGRTAYVNGMANVPLAANDSDKPVRGPGLPGFWAGFEESLSRFGTKSTAELVAPAIGYARDGFNTDPLLWSRIFAEGDVIGRNEAGRAIYMPDKVMPGPGFRLYQREAADTLERLVEEGSEYFYRGEFAEEFCRVSRRSGRKITMADMERYTTRFQEPAWGSYRGYRIAASPLPDDGGVMMIEILNILELIDVPRLGPPSESPDTLHRLIQSMNLVRREARGRGDPEITPVDLEHILSKDLAHMRYEMLKRGDMRNSRPAGTPHIGTCHVTVVDQQGNVCTLLHSSNQRPFGGGQWVKGVNLCAVSAMGIPGWRTTSHIAPNIVFRDDKPFLASGSPSSSLLETILQNSINIMDSGMRIDESVRRPRFGRVIGNPTDIGLEADFDETVRKAVEKRGVRFQLLRPWTHAFGAFEGIYFEPGTGTMIACGDPRRNSKAEGV